MEKLKFSKFNSIELRDWDSFVSGVYGRPYSLQQQNGCQGRGVRSFSVPDEDEAYDEEMNDKIPEKVNGEEMGG